MGTRTRTIVAAAALTTLLLAACSAQDPQAQDQPPRASWAVTGRWEAFAGDVAQQDKGKAYAGRYDVAGRQVLVRDADGTIVGTGELAPGTVAGFGSVLYPYSVEVPDEGLYQVRVQGLHGVLTMAADEGA